MTNFESWDNWEIAAAVLGVLMVVEGAALLTLRNESWQRFLSQLSEFTIGQVHTVGAILLLLGVALLLFVA